MVARVSRTLRHTLFAVSSLVAAPLLLGAPARAEKSEAPADVKPLDLIEALKLGEQNNRDLQAARERLNGAKADVERALVPLLPTLSAQGKLTINDPEVKINTAAFGGSGELIIVNRLQLDAVIAASIPIVMPSSYPALAGAKLNAQAQAQQLVTSAIQILTSVASSFFTAAGSDELVAARRTAIGVSQRTVDDARVRLSAGVVNRVEVTRAELALVQARQRLLEAEDSRAAAYRTLATLIRLPVGSFRVVPPAEPTEEFTSDDQLVDQALRQRPDLLGSQLQLKAIDKQITGQWLRYLPSISAFGNIRLTNAPGFGGRSDYYAAGAQLDWMLFDGLSRDAQRHSFQAQQRELVLRLDQLRDTITDEVINARRAVGTRRQGLLAAQRSVQMAQETLDLVRAQYEAGTAKQLDLLVAQDQLTTAQVGLAQARFDLALAVLNVRKVTGGNLSGS